jgi:hypothetical protein
MRAAALEFLVALALAPAVVACSGNGESSFHPGITFADSPRGLATGQLSQRFRISGLRSLWVRVQVADLPSLAMLEVVFTNPIGERFFEDRSLFSLDPTLHKIDDLMLGPATHVFQTQTIPGGYALDREFPIAGTIFTRVPSVDGDWKVQATVTGVPGTLTTSLQLNWAH